MELPNRTESMVLTAPEALEMQSFDVPDVSETGGGLLEVEMTSVCGSDIGRYQGKGYSTYYPVVFGHEVVGRVVEASDDALDRFGVSLGDRVVPEPYIPCYACRNCQRGNYHMCDEGRCYGVTMTADQPPHLWGGYGEYMYLHRNSKLHPVAEEVPPEAACLGTVIGNGVRWAHTKGEVGPTDDVVVIGPGAQGLSTVLVAAEAGADPVVLLGLASDGDRLALGEDLGATHTVTIDEQDPEAVVDEATDGEGPEVVVVAAPDSRAVELGLDLVAPLGRLVLPGIVGEATEIETDRIVRDEISIIGGRGQALDVEPAMELVEAHAEDVARINTHTFPVSEADTAIQRQLAGDAFDPDIIHAALYPD
ncbi:zinc-dependent alcohol dehydrogenase [Haloplanus pelagicus]|jgi:threonine dehydrogenase-like Zn-dependent dehydrogenase|uniref:zinc-dependent alcohol dehydrogenase n=1 Tax=Haloplanus pelagicus TaxID=2949995 RepID=UPI00203D91D3|nr:alcohol dehydrogenase catalytic domain-containing protein [Haloplanus sp. HW8-1]